MASVFARRQLELGDETVVSLDQNTVRLDGPARRLVALLDGTRDRGQLAAELEPKTAGAPDGRAARKLRRELDENLDRMARLALLELA